MGGRPWISGPSQGRQPEKSFRGRAIVAGKCLLPLFPVLPPVFGSSNRNPIAKMKWGFADHSGKAHFSFLRHTQSRQFAIPCWLQLLLHPASLWDFMKLYIYLILFAIACPRHAISCLFPFWLMPHQCPWTPRGVYVPSYWCYWNPNAASVE